jgi:hypothetical protein
MPGMNQVHTCPPLRLGATFATGSLQVPIGVSNCSYCLPQRCTTAMKGCYASLYRSKKHAFCVFCCMQVNKRGKVSSRPGPASKSADEPQQLLAQQEQGAAPAEVTAQPEQKQQPQSQQQQQPAAAAAPQQPSGRQAIAETPQVCASLALCYCRSLQCLFMCAGATVPNQRTISLVSVVS